MKASTNALLNQIGTGKLKTDKARIVKFLKSNPYSTLTDIERKLHLLRSTSSARVSELMDMGLVEEKGIQKKIMGQETLFAFQPDPSKQARNAQNRKREKYRHWVKNGVTLFSEFISPDVKSILEAK